MHIVPGSAPPAMVGSSNLVLARKVYYAIIRLSDDPPSRIKLLLSLDLTNTRAWLI